MIPIPLINTRKQNPSLVSDLFIFIGGPNMIFYGGFEMIGMGVFG